jgi:hypothetical protein
MANLDRGAYDADKLHEFDVDETQDDAEKSRLPLLVLIALVVLAAFGGVVWLAYMQGVERGRADAPRIFVAQSHPAAPKIAPSPYAGLNIYNPTPNAGSGAGNAESAPPLAENAASGPPALRPSAAAKQEPPPPPAATEEPALPTPTVLNSKTAKSPAQVPAAQPSMPPAEAKQEPPVPAPTVLNSRTAAAPAHHPIVQPPPPAATEAESPPPAPRAQPSTAATAPSAKPVVTGGSGLVQIGSYKSEAEAMHSWNAFKARHSVAGSYQPDIQKVELGAKGTWFRLRMGGLADKKAAIELCEKLKAQGASCLIAR